MKEIVNLKRKLKKAVPLLLTVSLLLNALFGGYALIKIIRRYRTPQADASDMFYNAWLTQFEKNERDTECDVLFLGDSLTAFGLWSEFFPDIDLINRGIPGDTVKGVFDRLPEAESRHPKKIFLMIGSNDLSIGTSGEEIVACLNDILRELSGNTPELYLLSILPRESINDSIIVKVNEEYRQAALSYENVTFLDIHDLYLKDGKFNRELYSSDRTHLNGAGYQIWVKEIEPYIA